MTVSVYTSVLMSTPINQSDGTLKRWQAKILSTSGLWQPSLIFHLHRRHGSIRTYPPCSFGWHRIYGIIISLLSWVLTQICVTTFPNQPFYASYLRLLTSEFWLSSMVQLCNLRTRKCGEAIANIISSLLLKSGRFTVYTVHKLMHLPVLSCHIFYLRGARIVLILLPCSAPLFKKSNWSASVNFLPWQNGRQSGLGDNCTPPHNHVRAESVGLPTLTLSRIQLPR